MESKLRKTDSSKSASTHSLLQQEPRKSVQKKRYILIKIVYKAALIFLGYAISYMQWSFLLLFVAAGGLIYLENRDHSHSYKIKAKAKACSFNKQDLIKKIDEIPSWVKFPDREKAEWLNQIIAQLWPTMNSYIVKVLRTSIQANIKKKYDSFQFESVDFGQIPPQIDGIKVYNCATTKDCIIVDFDVFYDGDCDVNFSISGAEIGGISDFQLSVEVRVVLKPLLPKMPLIGGIQIYFLNTPDISFNLDGLSGIPGLSSFIRSKIEEKITKKIVFPNKITKRFSKSVTPSELKALEPAGVLRVHVFEAKDLMAKDITGKSDPYCILYVGAQEKRTNIVNQNLNPKWDYWCEFIVVDPLSQHLAFKLFDRDQVNEDDFLGSGQIDISTVVKGGTDQWYKLENTKHGLLHLRFTWLSLTSDKNDLDAIQKETELLQVDTISRAILIVYVEMATNLPEAKHLVKPHPFFYLTLADQKEKSRVKKHTRDPAWEQGFVFLVPRPLENSLQLSVMDKSTGDMLTRFCYKICDLMQEDDLEISKREFGMDDGFSKIVLSLQLKILNKQTLEEEDDESETDSEESLSRQSSLNSDTKELITPSTSPISASPIKRVSVACNQSSNAHKLGRIELTLSFNEPRQKLLITVHQASHLPVKDPTDLPDPYVRLKMISQGHASGPTHRTKVVTDCANPVFENTFEYLFSKDEAYEQTLLATVKTKKFFNNDTIGQVEINLKYLDLSEPHRAWYDLWPKSN